MKNTLKNTYFALLLFGLLFVATSAFAFPNETDNFFGLKWGSGLDVLEGKYKNIKLIKDGDIKWYIANSGYTKFSGVTTYLTYQYYHGKFLFANVYFDEGNDVALKKALIVTYGEPTRVRDNGFEWEGKQMGIFLDPAKKLISIWSKKIMLEKVADDKKK